jgi:N-acyl-L-homoserine lactone synthetase
MIEIVHMPMERKNFARVLDSIDLRCESFLDNETWIGQSIERCGTLEEDDRRDCFHIINHSGEKTVGYARLTPVVERTDQDAMSSIIADLAKKSNRCPAFELQSVSLADEEGATDTSQERESILRELIVEALRVANSLQCKFIYTTSDRGGTAELRKIGLRYSTLSAPISVNGRMMVILCIAVTNRNIVAMNPFKLVGGTAVAPDLSGQNSPRLAHSEFTRLETLASLSEHSDDPPPSPGAA